MRTTARTSRRHLPLLGQQYGLSVATVTGLLTARTVTSVASRALLPWLVRHVPRWWLLVSATGVSSAAMFIVPLTPALPLLGAEMLVAGFLWGIGQPLTMSWVVAVAHQKNRSAALSVRLAGNRIGQVLVPLAAGVLAGAGGVGAVFVASGTLLATSSAATFASTRQPGGGHAGPRD